MLGKRKKFSKVINKNLQVNSKKCARKLDELTQKVNENMRELKKKFKDADPRTQKLILAAAISAVGSLTILLGKKISEKRATQS